MPDSSRLQQAQEEVEEVKEIMLDNLNKADERHNKLSDLEVQAEELMEKVGGPSYYFEFKACLSLHTVTMDTELAACGGETEPKQFSSGEHIWTHRVEELRGYSSNNELKLNMKTLQHLHKRP
uniref:V-SNARE coiled-coil homology domain-containing protein n=1 Tax=Nothobranchius furzeri TaxID=105023 RepID=A0A8C6LIY8_NOTFU